MTEMQFKQLQNLIQKYQSQQSELDVFEILKQDSNGSLTELLFHEYRSDCLQQMLTKYKTLNVEEVDFCFFRGMNSLFRSIIEERFVFRNERSVRDYLYIACDGQSKRYVSTKQKNILSFSVTEFLLNPSLEDNSSKESVEKESMFAAMEKGLSEMTEDCKKIIQKFYFKQMSHAEIVEQMPRLKSVKNSSAKVNRCLEKLRGKTIDLFKKLEQNIKN